MKRALALGLAAAALLLASCGDDIPAEHRRAAHDIFRGGVPTQIARVNDLAVYQMNVLRYREGGSRYWQTIFIVPNASVIWEEQSGKSTQTMMTASGSPAFTGLARLSDAERAALGLPPANDPRVTGLAKLTDEEKRALGVEGIERDILRRRPE